MKRDICNWIGFILFVLLVLGIALSPRLAHATGNKPVTGTTNVYSGGGNAGASASTGALSAAGGSVSNPVSVETRTFGLGAPGYSGASQCPVGVIPVIGGTTGAEFCRALWTALVTGDRGPVCKSALYSENMDEFCEDYWKKHGKP